MPWSLDSIPVETIRNCVQKSRVYMLAYLGGDTPGTEIEMTVKKFRNTSSIDVLGTKK